MKNKLFGAEYKFCLAHCIHVVIYILYPTEYNMVLLTLIYTSLFSNAFAQNSDSDTTKVTTVTFERFNVKGALEGPSGSHIQEHAHATFNPLVQLRVSFSEEMQNSINNL